MAIIDHSRITQTNVYTLLTFTALCPILFWKQMKNQGEKCLPFVCVLKCYKLINVIYSKVSAVFSYYIITILYREDDIFDILKVERISTV